MSISRNTGYNLVGSGGSVLLAVATVPLYLSLVGTERFGVLAIAWLFLGYFSLFDFGLGRATAHLIASPERSSEGDRAATLGSAIILSVAIGIIGAGLLFFCTQWYFASNFSVTERIRKEILGSIPLLALGVPVATTAGVLNGALQGIERFRDTNFIALFSTSLYQIAPLIVAWLHGPSLFWLLFSGIVARLVGVFFLWKQCRTHLLRRQAFSYSRKHSRQLIRYGRWVAISSTFGPLLVISDRFAIGAVLGAAAVAVYTIPFQLAERVSVLPSAIGNAVFPRISGAETADDQRRLAEKASQTIAAILTLPVLLGVFLMDPFLRLWLGPQIGAEASPLGKILLIAYWANAFAVIPHVKLQGSGRPDLVSKVHLLQIPPYLLVLYLGLTSLGLIGVALAVLLRLCADYILLSWAANTSFPGARGLFLNLVLLLCGYFASDQYELPSLAGVGFLALLAAAAAAMGWGMAPPGMKIALLKRIRRDKEAQ